MHPDWTAERPREGERAREAGPSVLHTLAFFLGVGRRGGNLAPGRRGSLVSSPPPSRRRGLEVQRGRLVSLEGKPSNANW